MEDTGLSAATRWGTFSVLGEVAVERDAQDEKWGEQNHPDGTGGSTNQALADHCRAKTDNAARKGEVTWALILEEEVYEAMAEHDPAKLRTELIQVAAVATAWVEAIDRRKQTLTELTPLGEEIGGD